MIDKQYNFKKLFGPLTLIQHFVSFSKLEARTVSVSQINL